MPHKVRVRNWDVPSAPTSALLELLTTSPHRLRTEKLGQLRGPERENLFHIAFDEQSIHDPTTQNRISDLIAAQGSFTALLKTVFMNPTLIGTLDLLIDKTKGRFPNRDPGFPAHRDPMQPDPVIDQCSNTHFYPTRGQNLKMQPGRSHISQIFGIGKKRKNFGRR